MCHGVLTTFIVKLKGPIFNLISINLSDLDRELVLRMWWSALTIVENNWGNGNTIFEVWISCDKWIPSLTSFSYSIVDLLVKLGQALGAYKISLDCKDQMIPFYESLGFKQEIGNSNSLSLRYPKAQLWTFRCWKSIYFKLFGMWKLIMTLFDYSTLVAHSTFIPMFEKIISQM